MALRTAPAFRFDLGIRGLLPEWAALASSRHLKEDLLAGLTVACIAVPLSLAIGLASGVAPGVALVSAIVGSLTVALFGGTPLAVSGPTATMAVLLASVVHQAGLGGLLAVGFGCGLLQLLTGILRGGRFIRFVPLPVITGFSAAIGALILIGQLPRALGLPAPDEARVVQVLTHIGRLLHAADLTSMLLALATVALAFSLPRLSPRLPAALISVVIPTVVIAWLGLPTATLGPIPETLQAPSLPNWPRGGLASLLWTTLIVYALASLETLLSSRAMDKLAKGARHDPDQELIGQGLGNLATALFGGIPVTGVIARSALNVQAGARSRRAALIHGLALLAAVHLLGPLMARIPIAVLAGVLLTVAMRMLDPREFLSLWKTSREEGIIYLVTFHTIVFVDLIMGIQAGVMAALAVAAIRFGKTQASLDTFESTDPSVVSIAGSLTFLAAGKLEAVRNTLASVDTRDGVLLDLAGVSRIDVSGAAQLLEILHALRQQGARFAVRGLSRDSVGFLRSLDRPFGLPDCFAIQEGDVARILGRPAPEADSHRLVYGVERFRRGLGDSDQALFKQLAEGQQPHTLFITCSDSRINPNLITSTNPGELFIIRNIGNMVGPWGGGAMVTEGAGVEFAVAVLGVRDIVLCAHSGCGAMKAMISECPFPLEGPELPALEDWLRLAQTIRQRLPRNATPDQAAKLNARTQAEYLKTCPAVRDRLAKGALRLHIWFYDIGAADLEQWDESQQAFVSLGAASVRESPMGMDARTNFPACS